MSTGPSDRTTRSSSTSRSGAPIRVEHVSVPRGGGAIRGMGEKYQAHEFSGAATVSIPLPTTPCRGIEPELEVEYHSTNGNGPCGLGWEISPGSISRRTSRGVPHYTDADVFLFDGQTLVPGDHPPVTRTVGTTTYSVVEFRARVETTFDRIEWWRDQAANDSFWRVFDRHDEISIYGKTQQSRISDPDDPSRIFEWKIDQRFDPRGNLCTYRYKQEDYSDTDPVFEVDRTQTANRYLERICYGNAEPYTPDAGGVEPLPKDIDWHFEIVFDYGEYDIDCTNDHCDPYEPVRPWTARCDPFSTYHAGFERRTHRLCRGVLMFHRFTELGGQPVLVHALTLDYDENPVAARLTTVTSAGYRHHPTRPGKPRYTTLAEPPLDFEYVEFHPAAGELREIVDLDGNRLPGVNGRGYQLVDLHGTGAPGVLYSGGEAVEFWRPALASPPDRGVAYERTTVLDFPRGRPGTSGIELSDLNGDGRLDLVRTGHDGPGFFRNENGTWDDFCPMRSWPADPDGPDVEHADLTGDGWSDRLRVLPGAVEYFPSEGDAGYGTLRTRPSAHAPPVKAPGSERVWIGFADVLGSGGAQRVRLSSGSVECWPSLGYGRFAAKVTLGGAPAWGGDTSVDQVYLADVDGSGAADIVLAFSNRIEVYRNEGGNTFGADPTVVELPRPYAHREQITFVDLAGTGAQDLVFTSDDPFPAHWSYDFCGGEKPHLLNRITNHLGATSELRYASSVRFFLEDQASGLPWVTTLPFPVQVVSEVTNRDTFSDTVTATCYRYHHGYYDPTEWEFRGFGMVERSDVETVADPGVVGPPQSFVEPKRVKTWFETGAWFVDTTLAEQFQREYFPGDPHPYRMPPDHVDWRNTSTTAESERQAQVALSGHELREEVWGDTGDAPLSVRQWNYTVRLDQPIGHHPFAVFYPHAREQLTARYERVDDDPRVEHVFTLDVDRFGDPTKVCSVAYERRTVPHRIDAQRTTWIDCRLHDVLPPRVAADSYLVGVRETDMLIRLDGVARPGRGIYYRFEDIATATEHLSPDHAPSGITTEIVSFIRYVYRGSSGGITPDEPPALQLLLVRTERAEFGADLAEHLYGVHDLPGGLHTFLTERAGYTYEPHALWWNPGLTASYLPASGFHQLEKLTDPFVGNTERSGITTSYTYDHHDLLIVEETTTPSATDTMVERTVATSIDYQALDVRGVKDANGNTSEVLTDELGRVIATSHYGTEFVGGSVHGVGFTPFDFEAAWPVPDDVNDLVTNPGRFVRGAESFTFYDFGDGTARPACFVECRAREYPTPLQPESMVGEAMIDAVFDDGFGRELQRAELAEPGEALLLEPDGTPARHAGRIEAGHVSQRWRIEGRVEYATRGLAYRRYQPYFASRCVFTDDRELVTFGIPTTYHYDAVDRLVRVDTPKGDFEAAFFRTVAYGSWAEVDADEDDTVERSPYYEHYITDKSPGLDPYERAALVAAAKLAGAPTTTRFDPLGHVAEREQLAPEPQVTRFGYDLLDRLVWAADPRLGAAGKRNVTFTYSMTGDPLKIDSVDSGMRLQLFDALGGFVWSVDANRNVDQRCYDSKHRLCLLHVTGPTGTFTAERVIYGDSLLEGKHVFSDAADRNLIGRPCVTYDQAQRAELLAYDLHGGWTTRTQQLRAWVTGNVDWAAHGATTWPRLFEALAPQLEPVASYPGGVPYTATASRNAVGELVTLVDALANRLTSGYHVSGLIDTVTCTPAGEPAVPYVTGIDYDAHRARQEVRCGSPDRSPLFVTKYAYDPGTLRLTGISTERSADKAELQRLSYVHDPVGNITHVGDAAPIEGARATQVSGDLEYAYDPLYRVVRAEGRALRAYAAADQRTGRYDPFLGATEQLERYTMRYRYDAGDNLRELSYRGSSSKETWDREIIVAPDSNRGVDRQLVPGGETQPPSTAFDGNGNQLAMIGIPSVEWDYRNRPVELAIATDHGLAPTECATYDAAGERVRRVVTSPSDDDLTIDTRFLETGLELQLTSRGAEPVENRSRRPIPYGGETIAERLTSADGLRGAAPATRDRYRLTNDLGSTAVELAADGSVITVEEYSPFGSTVAAWEASADELDLKQHRYSGQVRDQTTGLYAYALRHYAPWVGRWINPDPLGIIDGLNMYAFVRNNPISFHDERGAYRKRKRDEDEEEYVEPVTGRNRPPYKFRFVEIAKAQGMRTAAGGGFEYDSAIPKSTAVHKLDHLQREKVPHHSGKPKLQQPALDHFKVQFAAIQEVHDEAVMRERAMRPPLVRRSSMDFDIAFRAAVADPDNLRLVSHAEHVKHGASRRRGNFTEAEKRRALELFLKHLPAVETPQSDPRAQQWSSNRPKHAVPPTAGPSGRQHRMKLRKKKGRGRGY